jgi:hypothetical protein
MLAAAHNRTNTALALLGAGANPNLTDKVSMHKVLRNYAAS